MPSHDSPDRPRRGARLEQKEGGEPTLVGEERQDEVKRTPLIFSIPSKSGEKSSDQP